MSNQTREKRNVKVPDQFSLRTSCAPAWWIGHRSPRQAWIDGALIHVEGDNSGPVVREVRQNGSGTLEIASPATRESDADWLRRMFNTGFEIPEFTDPVISALATKHPGLYPFCDGSLFNGILTSIIGQSVSLASAAAAQFKLARSFSEGVQLRERAFIPLPTPEQLADSSVELIRACGVTWKRAQAIHHIASEHVSGNLPGDEHAKAHPDEVTRELLKLPLVGRWTAESVFLWGIGAPNVYPPGDVALLRAARHAYERPEMTMANLHVLAEQWQPARAIAARLLWTELLGVPPPPPRAPHDRRNPDSG